MQKVLTISVVFALCAVITLPASSFAQFGKLKDKVQKKVEEKVTQKNPPKEVPKDTSAAKPGAAAEANQSAKADTVSPKDDFSLYTKFDFVPGDKVLFYDDLSGEEMAEFPSRWNLAGGIWEIAKVGSEPWIMASTRGGITPKIEGALPEKYTVEFEFLNRTSAYRNYVRLEIFFIDAEGNSMARLQIANNDHCYFFMVDAQGSEQHVSDVGLPDSWKTGIHHIRIMVTKGSVKCYVDEQRVANAPKTAAFAPTNFKIDVQASDEDFAIEKMFIRNFRFAEGGKTMKEQMDETGKVVTHGIYFDSGSDKIKGESNKTLADIGQLLTDNPDLKVSIEGHTDSDGADDYNQSLSQRRAEAVRTYLMETYKIDAGRLQSKGWGEAKPVDTNNTPEGKANNRRVELVKIV